MFSRIDIGNVLFQVDVAASAPNDLARNLQSLRVTAETNLKTHLPPGAFPCREIALPVISGIGRTFESLLACHGLRLQIPSNTTLPSLIDGQATSKRTHLKLVNSIFGGINSDPERIRAHQLITLLHEAYKLREYYRPTHDRRTTPIPLQSELLDHINGFIDGKPLDLPLYPSLDETPHLLPDGLRFWDSRKNSERGTLGLIDRGRTRIANGLATVVERLRGNRTQ